jgi:hypothetical protein
MDTLKSTMYNIVGESFITSDGDLVIDGQTIEVAEPALV